MNSLLELRTLGSIKRKHSQLQTDIHFAEYIVKASRYSISSCTNT